MKTKIIQNIKSIILALILVIGVSYVSAASTWSAPHQTAPNCDPALDSGCNPPLNTGGTGQIKTGGLTLNTGGATNGLIVQSGNVGIGTTTPQDKLHIHAGTSGRPAIQFSGGGVSNSWLIGRATSENAFTLSETNVGTWMVIRGTTGNIGIGTPSPTQKLDVAGYINGTGLCIGSNCRTSWPTPTIVQGPTAVGQTNYADCPSGQKLSGGGCNCGTQLVKMSNPSDNDTWVCVCDSNSGGVNLHSAYAICMP